VRRRDAGARISRRAAAHAGVRHGLNEHHRGIRSDGHRVTQIHASLSGGEVFAVTGADGRAIVAVAGERSAPGLVFYDLKRCLAAVQEGDGVGT